MSVVFSPGVGLRYLMFIQNMIYRYDVSKTDDGVGGDEGTFCLCKSYHAYLILLV